MSNGSPLPINPTKWLLAALSDILSADQLASLLSDYNAVKTRYETASKLRTAQRELSVFQQARRNCVEGRQRAYDRLIAGRQARIAKLTEALNETSA